MRVTGEKEKRKEKKKSRRERRRKNNNVVVNEPNHSIEPIAKFAQRASKTSKSIFCVVFLFFPEWI
jgi:hypothetical protein